MPNRNVEGDYRYKYQGQEKDPETGKEAFELRLWDSRIGRWLSPDPYGEFHSPYIGMGNNPLKFVDIDGGRINVWYTDSKGKTTIYEYRNGELYDGKTKYSGSDSYLTSVRTALRRLDYLDVSLTTDSSGNLQMTTNGFINLLVKVNLQQKTRQ